MYFQKSFLPLQNPKSIALQKPTRPAVGVTVMKPRKLSVPRADITGVNVVVGTVAVALAVDTLAVFWRKYQQRMKQEKKNTKASNDD
jgi:hypothetical protein